MPNYQAIRSRLTVSRAIQPMLDEFRSNTGITVTLRFVEGDDQIQDIDIMPNKEPEGANKAIYKDLEDRVFAKAREILPLPLI